MAKIKKKMLIFITWVKEDNSLECCILIVIYLNILKRLEQLIQHSIGYPAYLWFRTVSMYHTAITCRQRKYWSVAVFNGVERERKVCGCVWGGVFMCACAEG